MCVCFGVMRNADSAGKEIAGWEPIASADKASSGASARAQLGRRSYALWGQGPQRAHERAFASHPPRALDLGRGGDRVWEAGPGTLPAARGTSSPPQIFAS